MLEYEYRAFGTELDKVGTDKNKFSYIGREFDDEINLYYLNARYYDATIGRFINVDPIQDGLNWYVYCNNNPLSFKDVTGLETARIKSLEPKIKSTPSITNEQVSSLNNINQNKNLDNNLIAQKDYKDKIGHACSIVAAYDGAIYSGSKHNKSDKDVVDTIYDQTIKKDDWLVGDSLKRIFEKDFNYGGVIKTGITEQELKNRTEGGFAILQFKQTDLYDGAKFGYDYHWIGFAENKYIDPHNGKAYNSINELKRDRGFPDYDIDLSDMIKGHIFKQK